MFYIDTGATRKKGSQVPAPCEEPLPKGDDAVWHDEDDETLQVDLLAVKKTKKLRTSEREQVISGPEYLRRVRSHHAKLNPPPTWASRNEGHKSTVGSALALSPAAESVLSNPFAILRARGPADRGPLLPDVIGLRRLRDVNFQNPSKGRVIVAQFHPEKPWILLVDSKNLVSIYEADGMENRQLFRLQIRDMEVTEACFASDGSYVVICGKRSSILIWRFAESYVERIDRLLAQSEKIWHGVKVSPCGRFVGLIGTGGHIVLLSAVSRQVLSTFRMNAEALVISFPPNGEFLFSAGKGSCIYQWSTSTFRCVKAIEDDSGLVRTSLQIDSNGSLLAVGSDVGVTNLYDFQRLADPDVSVNKPYRSLLNLTTAITSVAFHPSGELMAYASKDRQNGCRLVHLQSGRVFANWPKSVTPLGRVQSISFDTSGRLVAFANDKGRVLVYALRHFE